MTLRLVHYYPRAFVGDGGCSTAVRGWACAVAGTGVRVSVVGDSEGEMPAPADVQWVASRHRGGSRLRRPVGLDRRVQDHDALILHSGWVHYNILAAQSAARAGVPYVLTPHGAYDPQVLLRKKRLKKLWWKLFEQRLVARARAVHVFFDDQRDHIRRLGYSGPIIVAPTGLTVPDVPPPQSRRGEYLLWMGRFDLETKGVDLLLQALATLPRHDRPRARLHGPDWRDGKRQALDLVRRMGLEDCVTIGPPLYGPDKWHVLHECGLFVFPSRWDAQGLMTLEAAAAGAPLVVTDTTSLGRYLGTEGGAILVAGTPAGIAAGIVKVRSCDGDALGSRASQLVKTRFAWSAVSQSYVDQLKAIL